MQTNINKCLKKSCNHTLKELFVAKNGREKIRQNIDIFKNDPLNGIFARGALFLQNIPSLKRPILMLFFFIFQKTKYMSPTFALSYKPKSPLEKIISAQNFDFFSAI